MDPQYRDDAPRLARDDKGRERLLIGRKTLGSERGMATLGAVGSRDGAVVVDDTMEYKAGRQGGLDPHARTPKTHRPVREHPPASDGRWRQGFLQPALIAAAVARDAVAEQ
jgi:hypothetical protein